MDRGELATRIFRTAHLTGSFRLRSGATSDEYFDKYLFESDPALLREIARGLAPLVGDGVDLLAGMEMGGIPVATALSMETGRPAVFVRKTAKAYGTCKFAEGPPITGKRLLIIEDVVTSGGQIIESTAALRSEGATIERAVCVIDRSANHDALTAIGVGLTALFTMAELKSAAPSA